MLFLETKVLNTQSSIHSNLEAVQHSQCLSCWLLSSFMLQWYWPGIRRLWERVQSHYSWRYLNRSVWITGWSSFWLSSITDLSQGAARGGKPWKIQKGTCSGACIHLVTLRRASWLIPAPERPQWHGWNPWGRPRTQWRHYFYQLTWEQWGSPQKRKSLEVRVLLSALRDSQT